MRAALAGLSIGGGAGPAGQPARARAAAATAVHYDEVDVRGAFHHTRVEVDQAIALLAAGDVDWHAFAGETIGLERLAAALRAPTAGEARKLIVDPRQ